jgi:hypothetical protein
MQTYTITGRRQMPKTPSAAVLGTRHALMDAHVRPDGFRFNITHAATGRRLDRVVVLLPRGEFAEGSRWFDKLHDALPWSCRVTLVPEIGRIEIEPRGN